VLVPAKSGKMPVPSFCVEQGRWANRGTEAATHFGENNEVIAGKALKQAALVQREQGAVWENVKKTQDKLAANAGKPTVQNAASPTSLQLALEDGEVRKRVDAYTAAISPKTNGRRGAVGFVVAVNGKVTGAEVYGSAAVMAKAWPKALRSAATEALAEKDVKAKFDVPSTNVCRAFLADAEKGQSEMVANAQVAETENLLAQFRGGEPARHMGFRVDTALPREQFHLQALNNADVIQNVEQRLEQPNPSPDVSRGKPSPVDNVDDPVHFNVTRTLRTFARGDDSRTPVAPTQVNRLDGRNATLVECRDQRNPGVVIHRSFVAK
jgi:hypothetical protein